MKNKKALLISGLMAIILVGGYFGVRSMQEKVNINRIGSKERPVPVSNPSLQISNVESVAVGRREVGSEFEVKVVLTGVSKLKTRDSIKGVDAVIQYDSNYLQPLEVKNGKLFKSLTSKIIDKENKKILISAILGANEGSLADPDHGSDEIAVIKFKVLKEGKTDLEFVFDKVGVTTDTNLIAMVDGKKSVGNQLQDLLQRKPVGYSVKLLAYCQPMHAACINKSGVCVEYNDMCESKEVCATPHKKCSVSHPTPTPTPSSKRYCGSDRDCNDGESCVVDKESPVCNGGSFINGKWVPADCAVPRKVCVVTLSKHLTKCKSDKDCQSDYSCRNTPVGGCPKGLACATDLRCYPNLVSQPTPVPSIKPETGAAVMIQLGKEMANIRATLYGVVQFIKKVQPATPLRMGKKSLAEFVTDKDGNAQVDLPSELNGKQVKLFMVTNNSLIKSAFKVVSLPKPRKVCHAVDGIRNSDGSWDRPQSYCTYVMSGRLVNVKFDNLVLGDVYEPQDNVINSFDALDLIAHLGVNEVEVASQSGQVMRNKHDLNGDGVVNVRDFKVLLNNYNKHGEEIK